MKDWVEASTTTPFHLKWIPDVHSWIHNSVEMIYWSGQTFVEQGFTLTNFRCHLNSKRISPYARVDKDENILCYAEIVRTPKLGFVNLCRVIVRPDLRGKGLGKTFCKSLIDQSILMNGYRSIRLNVLECNQPAISCYQSLGFKISQRLPHARQIKNETYNVVVMTKSLEIK
jgi:ribosomal protein S18 acetylase RimI-like enzyme